MSIAGSAIAALQKEFSSSSARKITKPVKSPGPMGKGAREISEPTTPPFKEPTGVVYVGGGVYEDWGAQVCSRD